MPAPPSSLGDHVFEDASKPYKEIGRGFFVTIEEVYEFDGLSGDDEAFQKLLLSPRDYPRVRRDSAMNQSRTSMV
jgi:hypothetical protein